MKNLKIAIAILSLVAIGFVAGFYTHRYVAVQRIDRVRELGRPTGFHDHLLRALQPTEEQKKLLEPIVNQYSEKMSLLVQDNRARRKALIDSLHQEIRPLLTEEQISQLEDFSKRFHAKRKKPKREKKD
jgi:hypothetical protein